MSDSDRPRCQKRIVSSSRSRPGLRPATIWPSSACRLLFGQLPCVDVRAQRAERQALPALAPVVDDDLVHDVGQRELDRAHRAVGDDQRAVLDPCGLAAAASASGRRDASTTMSAPRTHDSQSSVATTGLPRSRASRSRERVAAFRPPRMHADLVEVEQLIEQPHVPVGGAARADVAEHLRALAREMLGAERGHRAGAHVGERVASRIARGMPVPGSNRLSSASSDGRPRL